MTRHTALVHACVRATYVLARAPRVAQYEAGRQPEVLLNGWPCHGQRRGIKDASSQAPQAPANTTTTNTTNTNKHQRWGVHSVAHSVCKPAVPAPYTLAFLVGSRMTARAPFWISIPCSFICSFISTRGQDTITWNRDRCYNRKQTRTTGTPDRVRHAWRTCCQLRRDRWVIISTGPAHSVHARAAGAAPPGQAGGSMHGTARERTPGVSTT